MVLFYLERHGASSSYVHVSNADYCFQPIIHVPYSLVNPRGQK